MTSAFTQSVTDNSRGRWLRNPILGKEMICSSRRRRFYLLRAGYLAALAIYIAVIWTSMEPQKVYHVTSTYRLGGSMTVSTASADWDVASIRSRMADMGKRIVNCIAWFQFVASQLIVVLIMCNSFNSELQKRTLPGLLTTPLGFGQIAWGKTIAGLWQILVLLACSLPLLALMRVFGGVPWDFVWQTFLLTVSSAFLAAAISFHFSILFSQPYEAAGLAMLVLALVHGLGAVASPVFALIAAFNMLVMAGRWMKSWDVVGVYLGLVVCTVVFVFLRPGYPRFAMSIAPTLAMFASTMQLLSPSSGHVFSPVLASVCTFFIAAGFLRRSAKVLHNTAHTKAWGERPAEPIDTLPTRADEFWSNYGKTHLRVTPENVDDAEYWNTPSPETVAIHQAAQADPEPEPEAVYGQCERRGSAVIWKDRRLRMVRSGLARFFLVYMPGFWAGLFYVITLLSGAFKWWTVQVDFYLLAMGLGAVVTAGMAAMTVAAERASRTWAILQTTPLSDWQIMRDKAYGVVLRLAPVWILVLVHTLLFSLAGMIPSCMIVLVPLQIAAVIVFVVGAGMLIGLRVNQTSVGVLGGVAMVSFLWLILPPGVDMALQGGAAGKMMSGMLLSPILQNYVVLQQHNFDFATQGAMPAILSLLAFVVIGAGMGWLAMRRFRRHAFE